MTSSFVVPNFQNGLGLFIPQIKRIVLNYCETSGSSRHLIQYFKQGQLNQFAQSHPHVQFIVTPRPASHPLIKGTYMNGKQKVLCVKNMNAKEINERLTFLVESADAITRPAPRGGVQSATPAVRGIWSPFQPKGFDFPRNKK
jgi:large subunit ribosomal protein L43